MKTILAAVLILVSPSLWAHCPVAFVDNSMDYCMDIEWAKGDKMVKGKLQQVDLLSPYLNPENEIPQKWVYSKALIRVWKNGDKTHVPVYIENLRFFPYMTMVDGMHHQASSQLTYDSGAGAYVLSGFSMQEMKGCWSLRWTLAPTDTFETSTLLKNISEYSNLDQDGNVGAANLCDVCSPSPTAPTEPGEHHHH